MRCCTSTSVFVLLGCAVLAHCQLPADDEDFTFAHEGSGRVVAAPSAGQPGPPPAPASGHPYTGMVHRHPPPQPQPQQHGDYGSFDPQDEADDYGSGQGHDDLYYDYDEDDEYYEDDDYYEDEDEDYEQPAAGGGHEEDTHQRTVYGPNVVIPEEEYVGVVHAAPPPQRPPPPPQPEQTEVPESGGAVGGSGGSGRHQPPPVYGTEVRPTQQPAPEMEPQPPQEPEQERDNGIEFPPESGRPGSGDSGGSGGGDNDVPDFTVDGQPTGQQLPDGMDAKAIDRQTPLSMQPGILAAVVGGAVVGLLCAILLVMLIVYRMRKKDEGSYALDKPKRSLTGNSYSKNYNKEFYA